MSHPIQEPPLRAIVQTGRLVAEVVDLHRRTCPCMTDRERLAYSLGASPECEFPPRPITVNGNPQQPLLDMADLEQLKGHAAVLLRQASIPWPPVKPNLVALLDPDRLVYIRMGQIAGRADHQLVANSWVIRVNKQMMLPAQRFAIMAESLHVLRESGWVRLESRGDAALDWLAKKWAGYILMPERWVRDVWEARGRHVASTASVFGVSVSAMQIQLRELGLVGCGDE